MKFLAPCLILFASISVNAECYRGVASDGSIQGLRHDTTLIFQRLGNAGGNGFLAAVDPHGSVTGETSCSGGAPDLCRFGTNGEIGNFQFLQNVPTIVLDKSQLKIISGDGDEKDLRAVRQNGPGFNYPLEATDEKVCTGVFPRAEDAPPAPVRQRPTVSVPTIR